MQPTGSGDGMGGWLFTRDGHAAATGRCIRRCRGQQLRRAAEVCRLCARMREQLRKEEGASLRRALELPPRVSSMLRLLRLFKRAGGGTSP